MTEIDGSRLKEIRGRVKALTVAGWVGVHASTITRIERGQQRVTDEQLPKILSGYAKAAEISPEEVLQRSARPSREFRLYEDIIAFASGDIWSPPADSSGSARRKNSESTSEDLASQISDFVTQGIEHGRSLTLAMRSEPYHDERLFSALTAVLGMDRPILYVSSAEVLEQLAGSHLDLKLRVALTAHKRSKKGEFPLFQSRLFPRVARRASFEKSGAAPSERSVEGAISGPLGYDLCHWMGFSVFVAIPKLLPNRAGESVVGLVSKDRAAFESHEKFLSTGIPDVQIFSTKNEPDYWKLVLKLEEGAADRRIVQPIFNSLVRPPQILDPASTRQGRRRGAKKLTKKEAEEIEKTIKINECRYERSLRFDQGVAERRFRQICDGKVIEQWVNTGLRGDLGAMAAGRPDFADVRLRLEGTKDFLRQNRGFEVAICNDFDREWGNFDPHRNASKKLSWTSASRDLVILERQEEDSETWILIDHKSVYDSFVGRFDSRWERLKSEERDKTKVIERINGWIETLDRAGH